MSKKLSQAEFVTAARKVHGNKYDYSQGTYVNMNTKYKVICPVHGPFYVTPSQHINAGLGCKQCKLQQTLNKNKEDTIRKLSSIHGDKYTILDWGDSTVYSGNIKCKCKLHGEYTTTVHTLLNRPYCGCPRCKQLEEADEFIKKAEKVHNKAYIYNREDYTNSRTSMKIYCKKHDSYFYQSPAAHLQGQGCPQCGRENNSKSSSLSQDEFIKRCKDVHGDKYSYENLIYRGTHDQVTVTCPLHGDFIIRAAQLLQGEGCQKCKQERRISDNSVAFFNKVSSIPEYEHIDFSEAVYINNRTKMKLFCKDHNEVFYATANTLLNPPYTTGCKTCKALQGNRWTISAIKSIPYIDKTAGYFYVGVLSGVAGFKIGITKNLATRKYCYDRDLGDRSRFNYLCFKQCSYIEAAVIELIIKKVYKSYNVKPDFDFGGKSEIYDPPSTSLINDVIMGRFDYEIAYVASLCTHNNDVVITSFVDKIKQIYDKGA